MLARARLIEQCRAAPTRIPGAAASPSCGNRNQERRTLSTGRKSQQHSADAAMLGGTRGEGDRRDAARPRAAMTTRTDATEAAVAAVPNLLDELDAALARAEDGGPLASLVVPHNLRGCDVFLAGRRSGWAAEAGEAVGGALTAHPVVREAQLDPAGNRVLLRLADERVAALGAALEGLRVEPFLGRDLATSERMVFDYCDPNATKALHVGHLRNVALGHALGCLAASLRRRSRAPDADRRRRPPDGRGDGRLPAALRRRDARDDRAQERPLRRPLLQPLRGGARAGGGRRGRRARPGALARGRLLRRPRRAAARAPRRRRPRGRRAVAEDARLGGRRPRRDARAPRHPLRPRASGRSTTSSARTG